MAGVRVWDWATGRWEKVDHPEPGWCRVGRGSDGAALYTDPDLGDLAWVSPGDRPEVLQQSRGGVR